MGRSVWLSCSASFHRPGCPEEEDQVLVPSLEGISYSVESEFQEDPGHGRVFRAGGGEDGGEGRLREEESAQTRGDSLSAVAGKDVDPSELEVRGSVGGHAECRREQVPPCFPEVALHPGQAAQFEAQLVGGIPILVLGSVGEAGVRDLVPQFVKAEPLRQPGRDFTASVA